MVKLANKEHFGKVDELEARLQQTEKRNQELQKEVKSMEVIQLNQGKALERISNKNGMAEKLKACLEELHYEKEKFKDLEEQLRKE